MSARVLCIGGIDSSGGAGLLRDAATLTAMGLESCAAVTAVTAQSDKAVREVQLMPPALVASQIAAACEGPVDAVKIGMLGSAALVDAIARALPDRPVVLDPVLVSSSGRALLDEGGIAALLAHLVPRATLLTPNLPELDALAAALGCSPAQAIGRLQDSGCGAVLVKGGHDLTPQDATDRLYHRASPVAEFHAPRLDAALRGTGCQLASAIAGGLAQGLDMERAVSEAKRRLTARFRASCAATAPEATRGNMSRA
ncbi:bifunctional hydroxymethylpyrimidine kinase/phosphomethylpyrimidine kinase [Salipiger sp.]|uniref:bifunctional hydroxymethylpyrimidine kinase/phosphomethylpyrimidine kinase n=1 Tax=Salipiger sp. TaxID=2078585 RepID=UPI003A979F3B